MLHQFDFWLNVNPINVNWHLEPKGWSVGASWQNVGLNLTL